MTVTMRNYRVFDERVAIVIERESQALVVRIGERRIVIDDYTVETRYVQLRCGARVLRIPYARSSNGHICVGWRGESYELVPAEEPAEEQETTAAFTPEITSPMPGQVLQVLVAAGEVVDADAPLLVLEAMKVEQTVLAPSRTTVREVRVVEGQRVGPGDVLLILERTGDS